MIAWVAVGVAYAVLGGFAIWATFRGSRPQWDETRDRDALNRAFEDGTR